MYISDAILLIIVVALGIYISNLNSKHRDELQQLREDLNNQNKLELSHQKELLENKHKDEIIVLNNSMANLKEGTVIPELEEKIKKLEDELSSKNNRIRELEQRMPFRFMDEARRCYEEVYEDMLLIEKAFWKLGHASNIHEAVEIHRNIADEDLDKIDNPEWLRGTMENYFNGNKEPFSLSNEEQLNIELNEKIEDSHYWFIMEMIMSLEEFVRENDFSFDNPYQILDFAIYFIIICYLNIKQQVGFKQSVLFFNKANENLKTVFEKDLPENMIPLFFHHRYSIYNPIISHYKNDNTKKSKIRETLVSFLYFDNKLHYSIEYEDYAEEEYDEDILTDYFPEHISDCSPTQKEETLTYIDNITSFALDQDKLNEIIELLQQL